MKTVDSLTPEDLTRNPVWEFAEDTAPDETTVRPVASTPVSSVKGKLVGSQVVLANGHGVWALIGNIDVTRPRATEHFLTISLEHSGRWFHLARYHDFDYEKRGPEQLAQFLSLEVDDVFPISYDLRPYVSGPDGILRGTVRKAPSEKLSRAEIIRLAVP